MVAWFTRVQAWMGSLLVVFHLEMLGWFVIVKRTSQEFESKKGVTLASFHYRGRVHAGWQANTRLAWVSHALMTFVKKTFFCVLESPGNEFACRFELAAPGEHDRILYNISKFHRSCTSFAPWSCYFQFAQCNIIIYRPFLICICYLFILTFRNFIFIL